jgi:RNA polymerase sigma-70 factor (ECF subfamily)
MSRAAYSFQEDRDRRRAAGVPTRALSDLSIHEWQSLLTASANGAEWAWSRIYHELAPPLLGYLRLRGANEPEDLLGEVFLQLARNTANFRGDASQYRSWAFVVAHNRVIDERRRRSRRPADPVATFDDQAAGNVEVEAIENLKVSEIRELLETLPPNQQDVLLMRIVGGFTITEVAAAIGKKPGATKALQRRGLARLEHAMREYLERGDG